MNYKNLLTVVIVVAFGVGMWGVGWVVVNPTEPWPSLDMGGRVDGDLSALYLRSGAESRG
jgi:hypothetical protein